MTSSRTLQCRRTCSWNFTNGFLPFHEHTVLGTSDCKYNNVNFFTDLNFSRCRLYRDSNVNSEYLFSPSFICNCLDPSRNYSHSDREYPYNNSRRLSLSFFPTNSFLCYTLKTFILWFMKKLSLVMFVSFRDPSTGVRPMIISITLAIRQR